MRKILYVIQLGRGLRLAHGKDCLTVLDFVGNARPEYDFSQKFRAMLGRSQRSVTDEIEQNFPHVPLGCSIVLQKQAREVILGNIRSAIVNRQRLLQWLRNYRQHSSRELNLPNFLQQYPTVELADIYRNRIDTGGGWTRLQYAAGLIAAEPDPRLELPVYRAVRNRLIPCSLASYLSFVHAVFTRTEVLALEDALSQQHAAMLHYDFWQKPGPELGYACLSESLQAMTADPLLNREVISVVELLLDTIDTEELPMQLPFPSAIRLHARYSRDQILAAFGAHRFDQQSSSREGVLFLPELNCELLFLTLQKTEERFSPTTLYHDYAISEELFHWQSQNSARPDRGKGRDYTRQQELGRSIILFVREQSKDQHNRTMGFVCLGPVSFVSTEGSQPMNITWRLHTPLPPWLWHSAAKLAVG
ncbi:DUF3427 domain-containing protein [Spirochaeta africana]|uniref:DUF3427 domain-containing protein n=1 Tax=Spirochaeta africana (strain ATCC 700263 / DSM 8902 / Z-7692) TaxID=889378 RepID=H9UHH8_SPIAZ|nr:DUF3427 domain-containing protein [Spirochaeta africana]AFG36971.1 protein of unknown function (DUF3427) [Spirochaeta africana DSM 8902]